MELSTGEEQSRGKSGAVIGPGEGGKGGEKRKGLAAVCHFNQKPGPSGKKSKLDNSD